MMTQAGRVVYDRKKNVMRPRDLARILSTYAKNISGSEYSEFILKLLKLIMHRLMPAREWELAFWRYLLNSFNRMALEEIFQVPKILREETRLDIETELEQNEPLTKDPTSKEDAKRILQKGALK